MAWTTAVAELRTFLSDGDTDKLRYRKRVINSPNGTITEFKTFEFRRISNFTTAAAPIGVYVNGVAVTVDADFPDTGVFDLTTAPPADGDVIEATYYIQWFLDAELSTFLVKASQWLLQGADFTMIGDGLQPAVMSYAAHVGYQKLAVRWAEHMSETYRTEDAPDKERMKLMDQYAKMAETLLKEATKLRDSYYTRSGQSLAPLHTSIPGRVREVVPKA